METSYMGLRLSSPVILGASELTSHPDMLKKAEEQGAAAVVYKSLFEEQIQMENLYHDEKISQYNDIHAEMVTLHPDIDRSDIDYYLVKLRKVKESLSIPVIASLNCVNETSWIRYAKMIEETGVDGIELNLYQIPVNFDLDATAIEQHQADIVAAVKQQLSIPVSVKLSSGYTNILHFAKRLDEKGIDGMVLFNTFFQPDVDIWHENHRKAFNLTHKGEYKESLRYAGMLYGRVKADICSSRGIQDGADVIKVLLSGASCVQVVSAAYRHGMERIGEINREIDDWMQRKGYNHIDQFKGKLSDSVLNKNNTLLIYKRAQYIDMLLHSDKLMEDLEW